jgi:hypothetical protein
MMKIENIIRRVLREQEEEKLSELPPIDDFFDSDWNLVLNFMNRYPNKKFYYPSDLDLRRYNIKTLGNLVRVDGGLDLFSSKSFQSLGNLERVGGSLNLVSCKNLQSLGNLEYVGGDLNTTFCRNLTYLNNLKYVGGDLDLRDSDIETLGNLEYVGGWLDLWKRNIKSLGNLVRVEGDLSLFNCKNLQSLGNLKYVGGNLQLKLTPLSMKYTREEIKNMVEVVGEVYL